MSKSKLVIKDLTSNKHFLDCQAIITGVKTAGSWRAFRDDKNNPWRAYERVPRKAVLRLRSLVARKRAKTANPLFNALFASPNEIVLARAGLLARAYPVSAVFVSLSLSLVVAARGHVEGRALQLRRLRVVAARPGPRRQRAERPRPRRAAEDGDGAVGDLVARRVLAALRVGHCAHRNPRPVSWSQTPPF